ncbi:MAG: short-chain dehydrogenase [SAR86 cluster bacterium BACL1 MAG-121105-bin34]|jgi:NAD(P)-dependent dehydrogenase (short-subunit alcohol dehydrogenase family)|uniref:Short-chain dehydrogenase n=2 Tax=SAR86 cluster TaxID=62672 RepID=A0A0R2U8A3_9GAMM|nr:MAG: short-chain dehydrogenase [SAR86 cluster bacterium BACL1 MAG-120507-bin14]KRO40564.1 MAG: short-chain dehydrogenase [SAR86 cluster bacterium BACL1 MAG-120920-bin57]KRO95304.1 MAG: short-chain dehydrogenase [SAR86 cluster bacterium BACL1 MAG-120820-bin45]KRO96042.1 MAG: short-chain dehydrogenase [SAR86 cluster bacterium BACL1 MAG-120828-bin5]KRO98278.1 MAG: short-chain dehydrogenase [SAR86 cluster bacterium BACL1 MAG-120823-bin87]KRP00338.1 MAG: short-chain dehydrogenase [SAR86 cluster |tara:strand:- start:1406 stop:2281 length:876 start_codon:yes stop_codon:yes gene_type:complete
MFKDDVLKGKKILVTGGGTGLGKEMSEHYIQHGAEVVICGRRESVLAETANEFKDKYDAKVRYQALDIRSAQDVDDFINTIFQEGPLHGLVNNAAGNFISPTKDLSSRGFDAIANIVFHGTFYVTHAVGKKWLEHNIRGSIISILATWVWTGSPFVVPSAMSKSALHTMTKSLAVEWGPAGIRVNAIAPGPFPTEGMTARLSPKGDMQNDSDHTIPMGRMGEMSELQNLATFLMSDGCDYLTGQTIAIDGAQYLSGGGTFSQLAKLSEDDWAEIRGMIKKTNDSDKLKRST